MNYAFPKIYNIDDVLWAIKDSPEFIVAEKDGYKVVNYVVATHETFPNINLEAEGESVSTFFDSVRDIVRAIIRRECRGLIFDMEGNLINRRYHKFFNVNERDETQIDKIGWNKPHVILEKLDGSMVSPCYVNGHIRWMTKMGITDTSMEAEAFVASRSEPDYMGFAETMLKQGATPIFEWCSNKNRIVLDYPEDRLVLTAIRDNETGKYVSHHIDARNGWGIPVVKTYDVNKSKHPSYVVDMVRAAEDFEGIVVRFEDGHMVKVKSDWYVRIHKVKSLLGQERDVVKLILNNELDDLLPVLPKEDVERVEKFQTALMAQLKTAASAMKIVVKSNKMEYDRKTFAIERASMFDPVWRGMIFQFWDKECDEHLTYAAIVDMILKHCGSNQSYAKVKEAFLKGVDYV